MHSRLSPTLQTGHFKPSVLERLYSRQQRAHLAGTEEAQPHREKLGVPARSQHAALSQTAQLRDYVLAILSPSLL